MDTIKVTLQNIKYSASLSEETDAFTAVVCLDGKPAFEASNHGTGGCNDYNPMRGQNIDDFRAQLERFEAYVTAVTPASEKYPHWHPSIEMDSLIGEQITKHLRAKDYQRMARTKLVLLKGTDVYTVSLKGKKPAELTAEQRAGVQSRNADCVILNFLPGNEGLERYLAVAEAK